uniref:Uncharacterized protein n=1 Tax=Arundo donax TaxID=35708 RepID=A0A0A8YEC2_ARUDO
MRWSTMSAGCGQLLHLWHPLSRGSGGLQWMKGEYNFHCLPRQDTSNISSGQSASAEQPFQKSASTRKPWNDFATCTLLFLKHDVKSNRVRSSLMEVSTFLAGEPWRTTRLAAPKYCRIVKLLPLSAV